MPGVEAGAASLHLIRTDPVSTASVARVGRHAPGFVHGMGLFDSPLRFASFTRWRSAAELRAYAYGPGMHRDAVGPYGTVPWASEHAAVRFGVLT